jgi:hypothetical protein
VGQQGVDGLVRVRIEILLGILLGTAAIATAIWPTWIEALSGLEPDGGSGETEWWIVGLLALGSIGAAAIARRDLLAYRQGPVADTP